MSAFRYEFVCACGKKEDDFCSHKSANVARKAHHKSTGCKKVSKVHCYNDEMCMESALAAEGDGDDTDSDEDKKIVRVGSNYRQAGIRADAWITGVDYDYRWNFTRSECSRNYRGHIQIWPQHEILNFAAWSLHKRKRSRFSVATDEIRHRR